MNNATKWFLVLPASIGATVAGWVAITLVWNLVVAINIVPQNDLIRLGLANFGINAISAWLGVVAGSQLAPSMRPQTALVLAAVSVLFALAVLAYGGLFRTSVSMSVGWHIWGTIAWVSGAVAAVVQAWKSK